MKLLHKLERLILLLRENKDKYLLKDGEFYDWARSQCYDYIKLVVEENNL